MTSLPVALERKNDEDFLEITKRIEQALGRIKDDPSLKASQDTLAKLANCSRGTLNNRRWPLEQLVQIKNARKATRSKGTVEASGVETEDALLARLRENLHDSREEVLRWKTRYDDKCVEFRQLQDINRVLQRRLEIFEDESNRLKKASQKVRLTAVSNRLEKK